MRRIALFLLIVGSLLSSVVYAADYRVLVIPDNIASKPSVDTFIYETASEFFANQVINKLNLSGTVEAPTVSEVREKLTRNPRLNIVTRETMARFKKEYNINYVTVNRLAQMFNVNKVLLITTTADAQNYFIRRTFWDFLNIPGATVIDPAIKLSTYAVLIDSNRDVNLWEDTFYKTISSCEARMVANQLGPQTQQLEKVRDYSRMLGPQIAHYVQASIVPQSILCRANEIDYGPKDFDNVFTKKWRWYKHGAKEIAKETDEKYTDYRTSQRARGIEPLPDKFRRWKKEYKEYRESVKLEKARIRMEKEQQKHIQNINNQKKEIEVKDTVEQQEVKDVPEQQTIKPAVVQPKKQTKIKKHEEPKVLNITKEEHLEPETVEPQQLKLKYYQPTKHTRLEEKNTTINDI